MSKPIGPYTPLVRAGGFLVVSGQIGLVDGALVHGGLDAEPVSYTHLRAHET